MLAVAAHKTEGHRNVTLVEGEAIPLPSRMLRWTARSRSKSSSTSPTSRPRWPRSSRPAPWRALVLWDIDWTTLSWHADDAERMARMDPGAGTDTSSIPRCRGRLPLRCAPPASPRALRRPRLLHHGHGSRDLRRQPAKIIGGYLRGLDDIAQADIAAWEAELRDLDVRGAYYFALTQCCFSATRPATRPAQRAAVEPSPRRSRLQACLCGRGRSIANRVLWTVPCTCRSRGLTRPGVALRDSRDGA